jgi:predicted house-cleaning noncanonical NTP pyrophosphatase (MazG superfamily)
VVIFTPKEVPQLASATSDLAQDFGTKGGFLAALPAAWTPEFILISTKWVEDLASGNVLDLELPPALRGQPLIVRSSVVGETIWDRGTFLSVPFNEPPEEAAILQSILRIRKDAQEKRPGAAVAVILQRFLPDCTKGTLGNLNRLSKTREHWARFTEVGGFNTVPDRFNSQRDAPADFKAPLLTSSQKPIDRLFGSACRWLIDHFSPVLGRDRMLLEWASAAGRVYMLQCDLDEDNLDGVDPADLPIISKLTFPSEPPTVLREPSNEDIFRWDKLKILDELSIAYSPLPQKLYLLSYTDAVSVLATPERREELADDLRAIFGTMAVIRVSRRAGADKTSNLPCTSGCLDAEKAILWVGKQLQEFEGEGGDSQDRAFIFHKYIGARAGAWALYDPDSPYIQVHANWGLPDSLQYYPYDAWDVHTITEEINAYPSYKSHFLWPESNGDWTFKQIRNAIGRHQCLKVAEVLEIARKTNAIGAKLGKRVAIMWFAGVEAESGARLCLPWYRTFEYSTPDLDAALGQNYVIVNVRQPDDLQRAQMIALSLAPPRRVALDIQPSEHLVREPAFLNEIISMAQAVEAAVIYSGSPLAHPYFQLQGKVPVYLRLHRKSFRTRSRIKYHKLVRDGIPERISSKHERVVYANLKGNEVLQLLIGKLIEEAQELIAAEGQEATAEELADVYEVLRGMMHQVGVDEQRVVELANSKRARVGGFDRGMFLLETSLPKPGESTIENRDVDFDTLMREEYARDRVRVPFALLGRLSISGDRLFRIPGSDQAVRVSPGRDGFELSLEQQEYQLEIEFPEGDDTDDN